MTGGLGIATAVWLTLPVRPDAGPVTPELVRTLVEEVD
jgi:hypothetical protein